MVLDMLAESHEVRITHLSDFLRLYCSGRPCTKSPRATGAQNGPKGVAEWPHLPMTPLQFGGRFAHNPSRGGRRLSPAPTIHGPGLLLVHPARAIQVRITYGKLRMSSNHSVIGSERTKIKYANARVTTTITIPATISSPRDGLGRTTTKSLPTAPLFSLSRPIPLRSHLS
jgi:hypothetical protein